MKRIPIRFWIGTMIFMTTFTNYMLRSNLSVSIISMVGSKNKTDIPPCKENDEKFIAELLNKTKSSTNVNVYDWSEAMQGNILAAYFWGYTVTSAPAGILSEMIGPWHVILWSSVAGAIMTGLSPLSASVGPELMIVNRFIIGLLGGLGYPAINVLIARWAPPNERGKFLGALMGNTLGTVVAWVLIGAVTDAISWEWGFYVLVIIMAVFCLVFAIIVTDSPRTHRWITEEEKNFIIESQEGSVSTKKSVPPYLKILTSIRFWAMTIAQFGNLWGLNLILTFAPKFMSQTMGFNIKASAGLAAAPYLARLICSQIFGIVGDLMRKKEVLSKTNVRKFFIIFSHFIPALMLFLVVVPGCKPMVIVPLLILNQAFNGAVVVSHLVNSQDLSPNFAGTLYGTMNFIGTTTGFIVPPITGYFMEKYDKRLIAAIYIYSIGGVMFTVCGLFFIIFGSGEVQPFNEIKEETEDAQNQN